MPILRPPFQNTLDLFYAQTDLRPNDKCITTEHLTSNTVSLARSLKNNTLPSTQQIRTRFYTALLFA